MNKLFINLTNHPSSKWGEKQLEAALELVDNSPIIDIQFPNVKPELTSKEVYDLAKEYADKIVNLVLEYESSMCVVHVMGEMTFTFHIVEMLKQIPRIICTASTTRRITKEENGVKTSIFEFVQFRPY